MNTNQRRTRDARQQYATRHAHNARGCIRGGGGAGPRIAALVVGVFSVAMGLAPTTANSSALDEGIADTPLVLGTSQVPGNLYLVPSVEWPTIDSASNIDNNYSHNKKFVGYFGANKCYRYVYKSDADLRRFEPSGLASGRQCSGANEWSGNLLNWVATQTIDPFRKAMTGGLRVKDTTETTWLEKARFDNNGGSNTFPNRKITNSAEIQGATPFDGSRSIHFRTHNLGKRVRFRVGGSLDSSGYSVSAYNPADGSSLSKSLAFDMQIRVAVCDEDTFDKADLGKNCVKYGDNYKPEGLIQGNALGLRYSIFGYLNDNNTSRDGGVLRANQKYVGPLKVDPTSGEKVDNPRKEWDPETGIFIKNPDASDASVTNAEFFGGDNVIRNSGVINYLNKFGQLTSNNHKSKDPVSELYYAMTRYVRKEGPVEAYHDMSGVSQSQKEKFTDLFPVITDWDDPIKNFQCSPNIALGIGDENSHKDKNLPGSSYSNDEPSKPAEVKNDDTVNVVTLTNKVGQLDGLGNIGSTSSFSGRANSAYIAGLAYDAHTRDQRSDQEGPQKLSTYWVDVVENQNLRDFGGNQYALATKYGGFDVPVGYEPMSNTTPLPDNLWWSGDYAEVVGDTTMFQRPSNYFVANNAEKMTKSLAEAFDQITQEASGSSASVAANSTQLTSSTLIYQGRFNSANWSGDVFAYTLDPTDGTTTGKAWQASKNIPSPGSRNIFAIKDIATDNILQDGTRFKWNGTGITSTQKALLNDDPATEAVDDDGNGEDRLAWLRGDHAMELSNGGSFRDRSANVLGDVVNSNPYLASGQDFGYAVLPSGFGDAAGKYSTYLTDKQSRTDMLYVGANDGMLHAFDATDTTTGGDEEFAFVPNAAIESMNELTSPDYSHRFYVDGAPRVADVYSNLGSGTPEWRTVLAGSMRGGGKAVFALDVSDPTNFDENDVIMEFTDSKLGYTFGSPQIVPIPGGEWALIFGDGYDETRTKSNGDKEIRGDGSATAGIFIVPLSHPGDAQFIDTGEGTVDDPNGIGGVTPVDVNGDRVTDFVYAGDLQGNLWKFDLGGGINSVSKTKLFKAKGPDDNPQPITAAPEVGPSNNPDVAALVYFGTGQFYRNGDDAAPDNPQIQSFYAIADRDDGTTVKRDDLVEQTILNETSGYRVLSNNSVNYSAEDGWYIDLKTPNTDGLGERVINQAILRGDRIVFQTNITNSGICSFGGRSFIMEMDAQTGGRLRNGTFDTNGDGTIDSNDKLPDGNGNDVSAGGKSIGDLSVGLAILQAPGENYEFKEISTSGGNVKRVRERRTVPANGRHSWEQLQ